MWLHDDGAAAGRERQTFFSRGCMATPVDQTQAPNGMVYSSFVLLHNPEPHGPACTDRSPGSTANTSQPILDRQGLLQMAVRRMTQAGSGGSLIDDGDFALRHGGDAGVEHEINFAPAWLSEPQQSRSASSNARTAFMPHLRTTKLRQLTAGTGRPCSC